MSQKIATKRITKSSRKMEEVTRKRPSWFVLLEDIVMKYIKERNKALLKKYTKEKTNDNKEKAKDTRLRLKKAVDTAKEKWLNEKAEEIESQKTSPKDIWKALNEAKAGKYGHHIKAVTIKMKKSDGTLAKTTSKTHKSFNSTTQSYTTTNLVPNTTKQL